MVVILKRSIQSKKFGIVFPAGRTLNAFVDSNGYTFVEHPTNGNVYIKVAKTNIKVTPTDNTNKLVCRVCGSDDVEIKAWVNQKTHHIDYSAMGNDDSDTWCNVCEDHTGVKE